MSLLNHDATLCRQCGGLCCQAHPGVWVDPHRFERLFCHNRPVDPEALPESVVLRILGGIAVPAPDADEKGCIFLADAGCLLPEEQRPCQCRALEPALETLMEGEMRCRMPPHYGSGTARENWRSYWTKITQRKAAEETP